MSVQDSQNRLGMDNAGSVWIHDNFIYGNNHPTSENNPIAGHGAGYGVEVVHGGYALIERNTFDDNRHHVTAGFQPGTGYLFYRNLILTLGGTNSSSPGRTSTHVIDVHGRDCIASQCGPAGEFFDIAYNTVLYKRDYAIKLRGTPSNGMDVYRNVFALSNAPSAIHENEVGLAQAGNKFRFNFATAQRTGCDFDRDGRGDNFLATGETWWYFSSSTQRWVYLNQSMKTVGQVTLGDSNGDGRCDVSADGQVFLTPSPTTETPAHSRQSAPDVRNLSYQAASARLTAAGLTPNVASVEDPGCAFENGQVMDQDPPAGPVAALRGGVVTLFAALPLPKLRGQHNRAEASPGLHITRAGPGSRAQLAAIAGPARVDGVLQRGAVEHSLGLDAHDLWRRRERLPMTVQVRLLACRSTGCL